MNSIQLSAVRPSVAGFFTGQEEAALRAVLRRWRDVHMRHDVVRVSVCGASVCAGGAAGGAAAMA